MTDSKYFTTTKKGEIFELKSELNSDKKERKREAVKKVIASMTVGKVKGEGQDPGMTVTKLPRTFPCSSPTSSTACRRTTWS